MASPLVQALSYQNSVSPAQAGIAPTDVVGAYKLASDVAEKNYQAQLAKQQAMFGGLAGLGGAGILAFGKPAAAKLFGSGASTAAGTPTGATDAADAANGIVGPTAGDSFAAPLASGADMGGLPFGFAGGGAAADAGAGSVAAADTAAAGGAAADAGSVAAADAAAGGAADAGAAVASSMPDWLMALLPFLA